MASGVAVGRAVKTRPVNKATVRLFGWLFSLGLSFFFVAPTVTALLPLEPYAIKSYSVIPTVACPGQPVDFRFSSTITPQPFATIRVGDPKQAGDEAFRTQAQWVKLERDDRGKLHVTKKLEPENYPGDFNGIYGERDPRPSMFQRFAPNEPGIWRQEITIFVTGKQLLRSVEQILPTFSTKSVIVRDFKSPECR